MTENTMRQPQERRDMLVIKASAGSGKTYTLTKKYIEQLLLRRDASGKLVLRNDKEYFRHILAITFTNKATDEMKRRIIKELHQLATDVTQSNYYDDFCTLCDEQTVQGLQQAAQRALNEILFNYSAFNVSTIDSFFQTILRNFARELDRDYNYEVQIDEEYAVKAAYHNFLLTLGNDRRRAGKPQATTIEQWVRDLIKMNVDEQKGWNFFSNGLLIKFAENINKEMFRNNIDDIRDYLSSTDEHGNRMSDLTKIQRFKQLLIKAAQHYQKAYETPVDTSSLLARLGVDINDFSGSKALKKVMANGLISSKDGPSKSLRAASPDNIHTYFLKNRCPNDEACRQILDTALAMIRNYDYWQLLVTMQRNLGQLGLLGIIDEKLEEYRKDNNCILIADTNELIGRVVRSSNQLKAVPFIYERVGTWINHYMIDEFQDTSHQQYENFLPLLYESLAHGYFNMIIGDAKQSIYRFRNADPSLFRESINRNFNRYAKFDDLKTNYRSVPAIVSFNNALVELMLKHYCPDYDPNNDTPHTGVKNNRLLSTYDPGNNRAFSQHQHKSSPQGYVRLVTQNDEGEDITRDDVLQRLPHDLIELHQRYRWNDIGILVSRREEGNDVVETLLNHNKRAQAQGDDIIPVVSDESLLLKNSPAVRLLVSMLRFIDLTQYVLPEEAETEDDERLNTDKDRKSLINRKRMSNQRLYSVLSDFVSMVAQLHEPTDTQLGEALQECFSRHEKYEPGNEKHLMDEYARRLDSMLPDTHEHTLSLVTIVDHLIEATLQASVAKDDKETAFLMAFQDCVLDFAQRHSGGTVREFLQYWDKKSAKLTVASAANDDAVTVMTIHKSKGLEFDCVVIPFAWWELDSNSIEHNLWMHRQWWDEHHIGETILGGIPESSYCPDDVPPLIYMNKKALQQAAYHLPPLQDFLDSQKADNLIDNLNKTYVAFTRPREELLIFTARKSTKTNELVTLLNDLAPKIEGMTQSQDGTYEMGAPRTELKEMEQTARTVAMPPYRPTGQATSITVKLQRPQSEAPAAGLQLHQLLERLRTSNDIDRVMALGKRRGIVRDNELRWNQATIQNLLNALCFNADTAPWFSPENTIYNERTIVTTIGNKRENYRPDRVVVTPAGEVVVVDYKFGTPQAKHQQQVRQYMALMHQMGFSAVKGYIAYLEPDQKPRLTTVV